MNTLKTTIAGTPDGGQLVQLISYPSNRGQRDSRVRQMRNGLTARAQANANRRRSANKAEMLIAHNFRAGVDLYLTLTYDRNPTSREAAVKAIQAFNKRMSAARKKRGLTYKYIYCTESKHEDGQWHHHIIISRGPESWAELEAIWNNGHVEGDKLRANYKRKSRSPKDKTITNVAHYMCKETPDRVGARQWSRSRNLKQPTVERDSVPENWLPVIPDGAISVDDLSILHDDCGGQAAWVKYWIPPETRCLLFNFWS